MRKERERLWKEGEKSKILQLMGRERNHKHNILLCVIKNFYFSINLVQLTSVFCYAYVLGSQMEHFNYKT